MAENLQIDGSVTIHAAQGNWCWARNLETLYNEKHRGADFVLPGVAGVSGNPRVRDAVVFTLKLVIFGGVDENGATNADAHQGLRDNIEYLKAVTQPVETGDGTRTIVWTLPDGSGKTGEFHVGPLEIGGSVGPNAVLATLDIQLDSGVWTTSGHKTVTPSTIQVVLDMLAATGDAIQTGEPAAIAASVSFPAPTVTTV